MSLARSAVALVQPTDALTMQGDTAYELAVVLSLAGRTEESLRSIDTAIGIYAAKGDIMSAARSRAWRDRLGARCMLADSTQGASATGCPSGRWCSTSNARQWRDNYLDAHRRYKQLPM